MKVLKKLTAVYIQNDLTLGYIAYILNLFNSHSFSNMGLTHFFFFNTKYFNAHTGRGEKVLTKWKDFHF